MKSLKLFALLVSIFLVSPAPTTALRCHDCVYDMCVAVGGDFGYRYCAERTIYRCQIRDPFTGTCLYYTEISLTCDVSGGCTGAV